MECLDSISGDMACAGAYPRNQVLKTGSFGLQMVLFLAWLTGIAQAPRCRQLPQLPEVRSEVRGHLPQQHAPRDTKRSVCAPRVARKRSWLRVGQFPTSSEGDHNRDEIFHANLRTTMQNGPFLRLICLTSGNMAWRRRKSRCFIPETWY